MEFTSPPFYLTVTLSGKPVEVMVKDFMFSHLKSDYLIAIDGKVSWVSL